MNLDNILLARINSFFVSVKSISTFFTKTSNDGDTMISSLFQIMTNAASYESINQIVNNDIDDTVVTQIDATSRPCKFCVVTAATGNGGYIRIGGSTLTSSTGFILTAGQNIELKINNTNLLYALASIDGEDVSITYFN